MESLLQYKKAGLNKLNLKINRSVDNKKWTGRDLYLSSYRRARLPPASCQEQLIGYDHFLVGSLQGCLSWTGFRTALVETKIPVP